MKGLRVLIVEDDALIGMLLAEILKEMGHEVCAIESTEADAVNAAVECRPDLMILDVRLANGNGISAVEAILHGGFVPHLFISGDRSEVLTRRPGAIVIQKPFDEAELVWAIQSALAAAVAL